MIKIIPDVHTGLYSNKAWKIIKAAQNKVLNYTVLKCCFDAFILSIDIKRDVNNEILLISPTFTSTYDSVSTFFGTETMWIHFNLLKEVRNIKSNPTCFLRYFAKYIDGKTSKYHSCIKKIFLNKDAGIPQTLKDEVIGIPKNPIEIEAAIAAKSELSKLRSQMNKNIREIKKDIKLQISKLCSKTEISKLHKEAEKKIEQVRKQFRAESKTLESILKHKKSS